MKKLMTICLVAVFAVLASSAQAADDDGCTEIKDGILETSEGVVITAGKDDWGYNYQANLFEGYYCDAYRDAAWCQEWVDVELLMKWNDAWLSNEDCDGDGLLDRHLGFDSYIGSGAWLTNVQSGSYIDPGEDGEMDTDDDVEYRWNYFVKIIAAPSDATLTDSIWYAADGQMIGPEIWGSFAVIQRIYNDMGTGEHGIEYHSPVYPDYAGREDPQ